MASKSAREILASIEIAERIVRSQGNVFIKEFLRRKRRTDRSVRIGITKDDILENLIAAIEAGAVQRKDLEDWVREVEGWGRQHVYLYHVSTKLTQDTAWSSPATLRSRVQKHTGVETGLRDPAGIEFPDKLTVSSFSYADGTFEVVWRKRFEQWNRDKSQDEKKTVGGDLYELRAYRQEQSRTVTRFVLKPGSKRAAVFLQLPLGDPDHDVTRNVISATLDPIIGWAHLKPIDVSNVIKSFDQAELNATGDGETGHIIAQNTRFAADGASVLFEAEPGNDQWKKNSAVRGVRRALDTNDFSGHSATFQLQLRTSEGLHRDVAMSLNGKDRRIYLHAQMTVVEVWQVLDEVISQSK